MSASDPKFQESEFSKAYALYKSGDLDTALRMLQQLLEYVPDSAEALDLCGLILWDSQKSSEAIECMTKAAQCNPSEPKYLYNLATMYQVTGDLNSAIEYFKKVLVLKPDHSAAMNNCAAAQLTRGQVCECESLCRQALAVLPDSPELYLNIGNALREQGKLTDARAAFTNAIELNPSYKDAWSNLVMLSNYGTSDSPAEISELHKRAGVCYSQGVRENSFLFKPKSVLKIGYVSADFREHSVASFIEPVLANSNHSRIKNICYYNHFLQDAVTGRLQRTADQFRFIAGLPTDRILQLIKGDGIDILVDLSGHTAGNLLSVFGAKAAPLQVTYCGYPNTTGINEMDYRIVDEITDPPDQDHYYSEKLYRLPRVFLCYQPPNQTLPVAEAPFLTNKYITFGSFNTLAKITTEVLHLWAEILKKADNARLLLKNRQFADTQIQRRYKDLFAVYGIDPNRIVLLPPLADRLVHLSSYSSIDIALDTFPYNGTTTTCEALWMGVPVITLQGSCHAARVGTSILSSLGLKSLSVPSKDAYVNTALFLSSDRDRLMKLRANLRAVMSTSVLCDEKNMAETLENAYFNMWHLKSKKD